MARLTTENVGLAKEIIARYPRPKSALIPLLHLSQEQDGYVTEEGMQHIAELVGITPAEVLGTCTFYEMFKLEPVGQYMVNICNNISCMLCGSDELIHHAEKKLGVKVGNTTPDGKFSLRGELLPDGLRAAECFADPLGHEVVRVAQQHLENVDELARLLRQQQFRR